MAYLQRVKNYVVLFSDVTEVYEICPDRLISVGVFPRATNAYWVRDISYNEYLILHDWGTDHATILDIEWDDESQMHQIQKRTAQLRLYGNLMQLGEFPIFEIV
jgi:hypothetical protein